MKNRPATPRLFSARGFTLIELMITVAVIAILATIAYPSYSQYMRQARRAEAKSMLQEIQLLQEKWRANNNTYGSLTNLGWTKTLAHYTIAISNTSGSTYTITATASGDQANDEKSGTSCKELTLTQSTKTPAVCW
jgi:type IV pilus assembly protein PilE